MTCPGGDSIVFSNRHKSPNNRLYERISSHDLEKIKKRMLESLAQCQLLDSEVPAECLVHEPGEFFLGRCHEKALEYLGHWYRLQGREARAQLVQGVTWRFCDGRLQEGHSWVEIYDKIVFEPVLQKFYKKACYETQKVKLVCIKASYYNIEKLVSNYGIDYYPSKQGYLSLAREMEKY